MDGKEGSLAGAATSPPEPGSRTAEEEEGGGSLADATTLPSELGPEEL